MSKGAIETRKDEVTYFTSDATEMIGKFLSERLVRKWKEEFVNKDTSEIVDIERSELILDRGVQVTKEALATIQFYLQSGDIKEVGVSNQRRQAFVIPNTFMFAWLVTVKIGAKKKKILLYASSLEMAIEVAKDYVELNFDCGFFLVQVKEMEGCIILKDNLKHYVVDHNIDIENIEAVEDEDVIEGKFYQISASIVNEDMSYVQTFIIETKDAEKAMIVIKDYVTRQIIENKGSVDELEVKLESAKVLPCDTFIEKDFSLAYSEIKQ